MDIQSNLGFNLDMGSGYSVDVKYALEKEVGKLKWREHMLVDFKGMMYAHFLAALLSFLTVYWYAGIWLLVFFIYSSTQCPSYSHIIGFVGASGFWHKRYMIIYGIFSLVIFGVSLGLAINILFQILTHGCADWEFTGGCSHQVVYSFVFFAMHFIFVFISNILSWMLLHNFRFNTGDILEKYLVLTRDIEKVIASAKSGKIKEQRNAAFELASLATTGDDSKFRIVTEGGLEVLISLGLSPDEATQEYAAEAIAELLTVPAIQDQFVEMGGVSTLTTLLHSNDQRIVQEAATALSYIVSDSEDNKPHIVSDRGMDDIAHAAKNGSVATQRIIAGVFLELAFNADIRAQMSHMNTPAIALIELCKSKDNETQRLALQTLELIAIECADVIFFQDNMLDILLGLATSTLDEGIYLLAGKILLYYAENTDTCSQLLAKENLKDSLSQFAKTSDPILQKVVAKIVLSTVEEPSLAIRAKEMSLQDILVYIRDNAADRDAWNMADEGIQIFATDDFFRLQPHPGSSSDSMGSLSSITKRPIMASSSSLTA
uniref:Protein ARABIDILLO 2-like n=1 Tax=Saccoglossus kowalevskii TaxID=10224 RepID=A0ABM0LW94_SACKO|nr:PREDICTED: protein ARABIDILLO 2-like [Saccoglossus kowalevskii]